MGHLSAIPTRNTVQAAWDSYCKLRRAVDGDPILSHDPDVLGAVERAHERWAEAFVKWNGK